MIQIIIDQYQVSHYLKINNVLSPFQSGFRPNYSTTTALVKLTNDIFSASDSGDLTGAIFIDLKKAFDVVDHYLLLDKLYAIGFSQNVLLWFNSYFHNRKQCVVLQGCKSDFLYNKGVYPKVQHLDLFFSPFVLMIFLWFVLILQFNFMLMILSFIPLNLILHRYKMLFNWTLILFKTGSHLTDFCSIKQSRIPWSLVQNII